MAKATINLPTTFLDALNAADTQLGQFAKDALTAGAAIVEPRMRANLAGAIGSGTKQPSRSTGQLLHALGTTQVRVNRAGTHNIKVGFREDRTDGATNDLIANVLEYGKSGQPTKPFLKPAKSATKKSCVEAMKAKLDEEMSRI